MSKESVTIVVDENGLENIRNTYSQYICPNSGEYIVFFARTSSLVITGYKSKAENSHKVTFIGEGALNAARQFDSEAQLAEEKPATLSFWIDTNTQLGSDEVGTGDFFGPVVVVASLVTKEDIKHLKELGIDDSKKITDKRIRELVPDLITKYRYCTMTCTAEKYNEMIHKGFNMNKIKAYLHNQALLHLSNKYPGNYPTYVDQFCPETTYYEYLEAVKDVKKDIIFRTKGESYYPCVALSSCIARYAFLMRLDQLRKEYGMIFPLGASSKVDEFAQKFIAKHGLEKFAKVAKCNFRNFEEALAKHKK